MRLIRRIVPKSMLSNCRHCNKLFTRVGGFAIHDNRCCSDECFSKVGLFTKVKGPSGIPNKRRRWKQVKAKKHNPKRKRLRDVFYKSGDWLDLRYRMFESYPRECMACGKTSGQMHVDHIKPKSKYPELSLDFNNLQILCSECNLGKSNNYEKDFRPKEIIENE